jgi:Ethylbenzene dehydrogenase
MINRPSLFTLAFLPAVAFALTASTADTVTALKVPNAPDLAAGAADPTWAKAQALSVLLAGGTNFKDGKTTATIRVLYAGDMLYMLVQYDDATESVRRSPYQKQPDGSWKKVSDPDDKGGDNNKFYEDKFALIWNIDNSIKGFSQMACMAACHMGEPGKPYGNKYTASKGELGDIWHMKAHRLHRPGRRSVPRPYPLRQGQGSRGWAQERLEDRRRLYRHQAGQRQARVHAQERYAGKQGRHLLSEGGGQGSLR